MMKAATLVEQNKPLKIQCFRRPQPEEYQVLVKIECSGICGAQINEITGLKGPDAYLPHLMGHEGSGVVDSVGSKVTKLVAGDRVVLHWRKGTGGEGPFPRYQSVDGLNVGGGHVTSFANMALISENRLTKVDNDIPFDIACLFGCGISTGYGIVYNELQLKAGAKIAVIGCGGVGLNVVQAAALIGASAVVAVDRHGGAKEDLARKMGATEFLLLESTESLEGKLTQGGRRFDAIIDTTGDTAIMAAAFDAISKTGTLMLVGQPKLGAPLILRSALDLFTGKKLMVSEGGGFIPSRDMPKLQELYRLHSAKMHQVITDTYGLDEINDAITKVRSGNSGRVLIKMGDS